MPQLLISACYLMSTHLSRSSSYLHIPCIQKVQVQDGDCTKYACHCSRRVLQILCIREGGIKYPTPALLQLCKVNYRLHPDSASNHKPAPIYGKWVASLSAHFVATRHTWLWSPYRCQSLSCIYDSEVFLSDDV